MWLKPVFFFCFRWLKPTAMRFGNQRLIAKANGNDVLFHLHIKNGGVTHKKKTRNDASFL
jgi:hypothetical protein